MAFLDINCLACGAFHHNGPEKSTRCPHCGGRQVIAMPHAYDIDERFKSERRTRQW